MRALVPALALLLVGCATAAPTEYEASAVPEAARIAKGAVKGAVNGVAVCVIPSVVGANFGRIGVLLGAYVTLRCLPFGIAAGAVIGGIAGANP